MSSSGTTPLSFSEFLFQMKARVRPRAAPSLRILSTRYCPRCPYPTTPILWEEELVAMSCADNPTPHQSCVYPDLKHSNRPTNQGIVGKHSTKFDSDRPWLIIVSFSMCGFISHSARPPSVETISFSGTFRISCEQRTKFSLRGKI